MQIFSVAASCLSANRSITHTFPSSNAIYWNYHSIVSLHCLIRVRTHQHSKEDFLCSMRQAFTRISTGRDSATISASTGGRPDCPPNRLPVSSMSAPSLKHFLYLCDALHVSYSVMLEGVYPLVKRTAKEETGKGIHLRFPAK